MSLSLQEGKVRLFGWQLRGQTCKAATSSDFTPLVLSEEAALKRWFPDSDVSIYLDHFQRDSMDWKHRNPSVPLTGADGAWGKGYWAAFNLCSADFCPLETSPPSNRVA